VDIMQKVNRKGGDNKIGGLTDEAEKKHVIT
jgi:hypothetical protein